MRRSTQEPDEPLLFDLPLVPQNAPPPGSRAGEREPREDAAPPRPSPRADGVRRSVEPEGLEPDLELKRPQRPTPVKTADAPEPPQAASPWAAPGKRYRAGTADVAIHVALLVGVLLAAHGMGVEPRLAQWPAFMVFVLTFSFFYTVVPLAFWGQTLGMAWTGIVTRNHNGEPLSFDQTARRWLGGLVTIAVLGLPLLVPFRGRTLADFVSGSETYPSGSDEEAASRFHTA
jgi:uncharacterized RDD family membrane protein YckC